MLMLKLHHLGYFVVSPENIHVIMHTYDYAHEAYNIFFKGCIELNFIFIFIGCVCVCWGNPNLNH